MINFQVVGHKKDKSWEERLENWTIKEKANITRAIDAFCDRQRATDNEE